MDRFLGQDIAAALERAQFLRDNADAVEEMGYTKNIASQELDALKDQLVENSILLHDVQEEKRAVTKEFNNRIKKLSEGGAELTAKLKSRTEYVTEPCFKFVDGDEVGYYNSEGLLVFSRPARPDEKQPQLFTRADFQGSNPYMRTGTDE